MYLPPHFHEGDRKANHDLIRAHPLGTLFTAGHSGLTANLIPFLLSPEQGEYGTLRGHLSKGNSQWKDLQHASECLVVFNGSEHYISPSWYPTKTATHKVVPTWNYVTVHVWGKPQIIDDETWLLRTVSDLTDGQEKVLPRPWKVADAPQDFILAQLKGIVGIELPISRMEGKKKLSQNRSPEDQKSVRMGILQQDGASEMAELMALQNNQDKEK